MDREIFDILQRRLEMAKTVSHREEHFWDFAGRTPKARYPNAPQNADGTYLARLATMEENASGEAYLAAMIEMNEFLRSGKVPEDVKAELGERREADSP